MRPTLFSLGLSLTMGILCLTACSTPRPVNNAAVAHRMDAAPQRSAPPAAAQAAAAPEPAVEPAWRSWVAARGGLITGPEKERAAVAVRRLITTDFRRSITVGVLDTDDVGAYAFPDGAIFITRGLLEATDDEELAAAVAHEMGHLIDGRHTGPAIAVSLHSGGFGPADPDIEFRADRIGAELLERQGISRTAMITMLMKVETSPTIKSNCRAAIHQRIDALRGF